MNKNWQHIIKAEQCPELHQLEMYYAGQLSDKERFVIERHLLNCEMCADYVEGLSLMSTISDLDHAENEVKRQIHTLLFAKQNRFIGSLLFKRLAVAASVLALVTSSLIIYYNVDTTKQIAKVSEPKATQLLPNTIIDSSVFKSDNKQKLIAKSNNERVLAFKAPEVVDSVYSEVLSMEDAKAEAPSPQAIVSMDVSSNEKTLTGVVTDESGSPLPGVNINVKGTTRGVVSDVDGKFNLAVNVDDSVLNVSYIGYKSETVAVKDQQKIDLALKPDVYALNEVVVVGYGVQKKSMVTGSISTVKADEMVDRKTRRLLEQNKQIELKADSVELTCVDYKQLSMNCLQLNDYSNSKKNLENLKDCVLDDEIEKKIDEALILLEKREFDKAYKIIKKLKLLD